MPRGYSEGPRAGSSEGPRPEVARAGSRRRSGRCCGNLGALEDAAQRPWRAAHWYLRAGRCGEPWAAAAAALGAAAKACRALVDDGAKPPEAAVAAEARLAVAANCVAGPKPTHDAAGVARHGAAAAAALERVPPGADHAKTLARCVLTATELAAAAEGTGGRAGSCALLLTVPAP